MSSPANSLRRKAPVNPSNRIARLRRPVGVWGSASSTWRNALTEKVSADAYGWPDGRTPHNLGSVVHWLILI